MHPFFYTFGHAHARMVLPAQSRVAWRGEEGDRGKGEEERREGRRDVKREGRRERNKVKKKETERETK